MSVIEYQAAGKGTRAFQVIGNGSQFAAAGTKPVGYDYGLTTAHGVPLQLLQQCLRTVMRKLLHGNPARSRSLRPPPRDRVNARIQIYRHFAAGEHTK